MSPRRAGFGIAAAAAVYLAAVALGVQTGMVPLRPLYDGFAPPAPYRWVNPPPDFAKDNQPATGVKHPVALGADGSEAASIVTDDGQAAVVLRAGTFPARAGEREIQIEISPLDPATVAPPPSGSVYDGNAYRFKASYAASGADAAPGQAVSIVLRYPTIATQLLRLDGSSWTKLDAKPVTASLQIFAESDRLGAFAAARPRSAKAPGAGFPWVAVVSAAAALAAALAGFLGGRVSRARKRRAAAARPKKRKKPGPGPAKR